MENNYEKLVKRVVESMFKTNAGHIEIVGKNYLIFPWRIIFTSFLEEFSQSFYN